MNKIVTLLGMSGAGKTHFSQRAAAWGWVHYSNDYLIGARYLGEHLGATVQVDDLSWLSKFIGQVGDEALGGLPLDEFKRRQRLYYDAECRVLQDMAGAISESAGHFINDSTGSFCEVTDEALIAEVAKHGPLVYIETDKASHDDIIARAVEYPKPLYFPMAGLDAWLGEFCEARGVGVDKIVPNEFSAWVFPKLFESRLPKYERLAREYGMSVGFKDLHGCADEAAFLELIGG